VTNFQTGHGTSTFATATLLVVFFTTLLLDGLIGPAKALEFERRTTETGGSYIFADGDIREGDTEELERLIHKGYAEDRILVLNSPGGLLWEGVLLGRKLRHYRFQTYVSGSGLCYSACFFAFAGGEYRWVNEGGKLGVHRFSGAAGDQRATRVWTGMLLDEVLAAGIDFRALKKALIAPPDEIYVFSRTELANLGILRNSNGASFLRREAGRLGISEKEYLRRRRAFLSPPERQKCFPVDAAQVARAVCFYAVLQQHGSRR
jgi:hypothetical protein